MTVSLDDLLPPIHPVLTPGEAQYAAQTYIRMGWAVTAGPGLDEAGVCSCYRAEKCGKNAGKHAHAGWGNDKRRTLSYDDASRYWDPSNAEWEDKAVDQVFIVPYLSGIAVADVDNMDAWLRLPEVDRPATLFQRSGSGRGGHFIYRFCWDVREEEPPRLKARLPNGAGEIKFRGIIAAAPDPHRTGGRYEWENWGHDIADAPEWMTEEREAGDAWDGIVDPTMLVGFWGDAMFMGEMADLERVGTLGAGAGRPVVLFAVASKMMKWVKAGKLTEEELFDKLIEVAHQNGAARDYGAEDIERQIRNGLKAGAKAKATEEVEK
jgi:hypothetical protein